MDNDLVIFFIFSIDAILLIALIFSIYLFNTKPKTNGNYKKTTKINKV